MDNEWKLIFRVYRYKTDGDPYYQDFPVEINPDEYVLDGIEKIWAYQDRSLVYRHACHHSTCGACGMRINHREKLTCITRIRDITHDGGQILVEPLRNMPIISDLAVDMGQFFRILDEIDYNQVQPVSEQPLTHGIQPQSNGNSDGMDRLVDCLECGLCISACPSSATSPDYRGPAALAAIQAKTQNIDPASWVSADDQDGVWRCHSAFECTDVCPSSVEPGWRIMDLRRKIIVGKIRNITGRKEVNNE